MAATLPDELVEAVIGWIAALPEDEIDIRASVLARSSVYACALVARRWRGIASRALARSLIVIRDQNELDRTWRAHRDGHLDLRLVGSVTVGDFDLAQEAFSAVYDRIRSDPDSGYDAYGEALDAWDNPGAPPAFEDASEEAVHEVNESGWVLHGAMRYADGIYGLLLQSTAEVLRAESYRSINQPTSQWAWPVARLVVGRMRGERADWDSLAHCWPVGLNIYDLVKYSSIQSLTVLDARDAEAGRRYDAVRDFGDDVEALDLGYNHPLTVMRPLFHRPLRALRRLSIGLDRFISYADDAQHSWSDNDALHSITSSRTTTILFGHGAESTPKLEHLRLRWVVLYGEQVERLLRGAPGSLRSVAFRIGDERALVRIDGVLKDLEIVPNLGRVRVDVVSPVGVCTVNTLDWRAAMICCRRRGVKVEIRRVNT